MSPARLKQHWRYQGSSAQSKIQRYPGDCDYFERVNIIAPTKEEACQILADIMREKALDFRQGPTYQLIEVKLGSYPAPFVQGKATLPAGAPISWRPDEIEDGKKVGFTEDGKPFEILWDDAAQNPGWCKLDWGGGRPDPGVAGQCQQHAGCDLGGAGRRDHAAGWLFGPLFPGGLFTGRVGADLLQAGPACERRCSR